MSPFDKISISEILPQREPFLFVDCLVHYDERETVTASWTVSSITTNGRR